MRIKESPNDKAKSCPSEVCVPKSLISKIFEPFLKSCPSEVRVPWGRVPRGFTVFRFEKLEILMFLFLFQKCVP